MIKSQRFKYLFLGINILGMLGLMISVSYFSHQQTTCVFDALGFRCFGCNTLGALDQLAKGNVRGAIRQNALIFLWLMIVSVLTVNEVYHILRKSMGCEKEPSLLDRLLRKMFIGKR